MKIDAVTSIKNHVATISFSSPTRHYMTLALLQAIETEFIAAENNTDVRVIVLKNQEPGFFITHYCLDEINKHISTGIKIKALAGRLFPLSIRVMMTLAKMLIRFDSNASMKASIDALSKGSLVETSLTYARVNRFLLTVRNSQKPVIAAIGGNAQGFGMELSLACDYRIMARGDFYLGQIESLVGLIPGSGGLHSLTRLLGEAKTLELAMLGTRLNADQAQSIGLVNKAVDPEQLEPKCQELAEQLVKRSAPTLAYIKANTHQGHNLSFERALQYDEVAFIDTACTNQAVNAYRWQQAHLKTTNSVNQSFDEHEQLDLNSSQE